MFKKIKLFFIIFALPLFIGCTETLEKIDNYHVENPIERGLTWIALAIVVHALFNNSK